MNAPRLIGVRMALGLQRKLDLTEDQAYVAVAPHYIDGSPPRVVQVVPGAVRLDGGGEGAQDGGAYFVAQDFTLHVWYTIRLDPHQWTQQALVEEAEGLLDFFEAIRGVFKFTRMGTGDNSILYRPLVFKGESATAWFDEERGILTRNITFEASYGEDLPTTPTLTDTDVA